MRDELRLLSVFLFAVLLALVVGSAQAQNSRSEKLNVGPGESIQDAVKAADPGDTIVVRGTHRETVVVRKNGISLRGAQGVLKPPKKPTSPCGPSGICVLGDVNFDTGKVSKYVKNVTVSGFTVRGFRDIGIVAFGARDAAFVSNETIGNGEYGIAAFASTGTRVTSNLSRGADEAGIYVGDSPKANAKVFGNETYDNLFGIFVRNALHGSISGNRVHDNCMGVLFLADAPGPSGLFEVSGNRVQKNTRACPSTEEGVPPISGVGIGLLGAKGVEIKGNQIEDNKPSGPTAFHGGVVVVRGIGGTPPKDNSVSGNRILRNAPDIFWDESGSGNRLTGNRCETSKPAQLCS